MVKRTRKPPIRPEVRRAWLRRNEEDGESPPQIAAKDGYDVRTVRKQIELVKQEREAREARSVVLRNALESHYRDLCKYAESLNAMITGVDRFSSPAIDVYMESALRQHLPRSPLWKDLSKLEQLNRRLTDLEDDVKRRLKDEIEHDSRLGKILAAGESQAIAGITEVLASQSKAWAQEWEGLNIKDNFKVKPIENGSASVEYGFAQMGKVQEDHAKDILEVITDYQSKITTWEQFENMRKLFTELKRVKLALQDELAIITRRRIVLGKCKYCPL